MTGAIIINKPIGMTSRDVINKLNRILETKSIGHIGTLDPLASGVLVCLIGRATKLANILVNHDKEYIATFKLGILTDTLDIEGKIIYEENYQLDKAKLKEVLHNYLGTYHQEVPIYSAIKKDGKKLYEYARNNEEVELPKKEVTIHSLELLNIDNNLITIKTRVSKGTYIRSLIRDIAVSLGTTATLTALERTKLGDYNINDSCTLEDVLNNNFKLYSINEILKDYPHEEINPEMLFKIRNGQILDKKIKDYLLFTYNDKPIALYQKYAKNPDQIKPAIIFYIITN